MKLNDELSSIHNESQYFEQEKRLDFDEDEPKKSSLEEAIKRLQQMVVQMGFPEPGNLKSKKSSEVKKTLKCFSAILKQ